jgi:hypothetical protein
MLGNLSTKNRLTDRFFFLSYKSRQVSLDRLFSGISDRKVKQDLKTETEFLTEQGAQARSCSA